MRIDRVLWSERSVAHITRHEITPEEVEDVLFSPPLDARHGKREGTYLVFGRSLGGRQLLVVIAPRPIPAGHVVANLGGRAPSVNSTSPTFAELQTSATSSSRTSGIGTRPIIALKSTQTSQLTRS